jgi:hypothetical protein
MQVFLFNSHWLNYSPIRKVDLTRRYQHIVGRLCPKELTSQRSSSAAIVLCLFQSLAGEFFRAQSTNDDVFVLDIIVTLEASFIDTH